MPTKKLGRTKCQPQKKVRTKCQPVVGIMSGWHFVLPPSSLLSLDDFILCFRNQQPAFSLCTTRLYWCVSNFLIHPWILCSRICWRYVKHPLVAEAFNIVGFHLPPGSASKHEVSSLLCSCMNSNHIWSCSGGGEADAGFPRTTEPSSLHGPWCEALLKAGDRIGLCLLFSFAFLFVLFYLPFSFVLFLFLFANFHLSIFIIGSESDHCSPLSLTNWLTN